MELTTENKKPVSPRKKIWILAVCAAAALAVITGVGVFAALSSASDDTICRNVYVGDTALEGMTEAEAAEAIEKDFSKYIQGKKVVLTAEDKACEIYIDTLSPSADFKALAKSAMEIGHSKNFIANFFTTNKLKNKKEIIPIEMVLDEQTLYSRIAYFAGSLLEEEGIISFDYENNQVAVDTDKAKNPVDTDKVVKSFKTSVNTGSFKDVELVYTDAPKAEDSAELLYSLITREPVDAQMSFADGTLEFIDEINGVAIERSELIKAVEQGGIVTVPFTPIAAQVSKAELRQQAFNVTLATHTTYFSTGVAGRANNIRKAAEKINGHIMMPGDEFSYNGVVGKRTLEAGFDYANAYAGNKIIQEVGGGICQVSSTLYVAVLYSDLKVTMRRNHNLPVSYVPLGMDATVSYGTIDFCFVNDTDKPIMIKTSVNGGTLTVSINGFEKDETKKVEIYTNNIGTKPYVEETVEDSSVTQPVVKQNGVNGAVVETYKVVYINGVEKSRKKLHTSTYQPENKIVHIPPVTEEPTAEEPPAEVIPAQEENIPPVNDAPVDVIDEREF